MRITFILIHVLSIAFPTSAFGAFQFYDNQAEWNAVVGNDFTTIDFTGWPDFTIITDQYQHLGVLFTDGTDRARNNWSLFPNDGSGLYGAVTTITVKFDQPINWMANWRVASCKHEFYLGGMLIYVGPTLVTPTNFHFAGFVSDQPFDSVRIFSPTGGAINVDDLYFQSPIPAPGALVLLGLAALNPRRRRRD